MACHEMNFYDYFKLVSVLSPSVTAFALPFTFQFECSARCDFLKPSR